MIQEKHVPFTNSVVIKDKAKMEVKTTEILICQ